MIESPSADVDTAESHPVGLASLDAGSGGEHPSRVRRARSEDDDDVRRLIECGERLGEIFDKYYTGSVRCWVQSRFIRPAYSS